MGTLYVVRHGQAAFGTDHYDRLTDVGFIQSRLLGAYFGARGIRFDAVFTGTLRRQIETARAIVEGRAELGAAAHETAPGLDEYKPEAILSAWHALAVTSPETAADQGAALRRDPAVIREHFRTLRDALLAWVDGRTQPVGMAPFRTFQDDAVAALSDARRRFPDGHVLVVSSGGCIAAVVAQALRAPPTTAIELNLRIRNCSLTEFASTARRHHLVSFNGLPHLDMQSDASLITHA